MKCHLDFMFLSAMDFKENYRRLWLKVQTNQKNVRIVQLMKQAHLTTHYWVFFFFKKWYQSARTIVVEYKEYNPIWM